MTNFNENLKIARIKSGLTSQQIADLIDVNIATYRNYESGAREPRFDTLVKLCKVLKVTSDELLGINKPIGTYTEPQQTVIDAKTISAFYNALPESQKNSLKQQLLSAALSDMLENEQAELKEAK